MLSSLLAVTSCGGSESGSDTAESGSDETATGTEGSTETDGSACTPQIESIRTEIFAGSCATANCHDEASGAAGLNLDAADLAAELVGVASGTCDGWVRVAPGSPEDSLLYAKVAGPVPCGGPMPLGGPPLGDIALACLSDWILSVDSSPCETCGEVQCIDVQSDAQNCGTCGNQCPDGLPCQVGQCMCPDGHELCGDTCIDTEASVENCGGCGEACEANKVCFFGTCADTCGALTECDGGCVDSQSDPFNCGGCDNACDPGTMCEAGGCECPGDGVSFASDVQPIFNANCTGKGCHAFPAPSAMLDLAAGSAWESLVDVDSGQCNARKRVAPGQPGNSYLMDKLQGINLCFGTQMPKVGGPLSQADITTVSEWICRGAKDD